MSHHLFLWELTFYGAFVSVFKHKGSSQHSLSQELKLVHSSKFPLLCSLEERIEKEQTKHIFPYFVTILDYGTFAKILPSSHCVFVLSHYRVQNHLFFLIAQQQQLDNTSTPLQPKGPISFFKSSLNSTTTIFYFPRLFHLDQLVLFKRFLYHLSLYTFDRHFYPKFTVHSRFTKGYTFCQFMCSPGIKPLTLSLLEP